MATKTAILYARVSREEQVRGYSLRQQLEALREHAESEGYEVVAEAEDPAYSGAELVRPGLDRVRDLVEAGEPRVDVVFAQDADRITREPMHRMVLDDEAAKHGCRWVALDDWGGDSHEGQLLRFMKGWVSKGERLKTAERTRRGSLRKVREGKLIRSRRPNYGFRYVGAKGDHYEVDEARMAVVRRLFEEVAKGTTLHTLRKALVGEGVPSPAGRPASWSRTQIKRLILEDVYRPHTVEELRTLGVGEDVIAGLGDGDACGVWYYNRRDVTSERVRDKGEYRKRATYTLRDRDAWIAVPVPDAGVPLEHVEKARAAVESNTSPSKAAGREWELSGGIARCRVCGYTMRTRTRARDNGGDPLLYYVCSRARKDEGPRPCRATKNHRAEALEREVVALVDGELLADRETLERWIERAMGAKGRGARRDATASESACAKALEEVARERDRLVRLYTTGRIGDAEYDAHAGELDDREAAARAELDRTKREAEDVRMREDNRRTILEAYGTGLQLGLHYFPPHLRRQVYGALGITAYVSPDGAVEIEGYFDADVIRLTREVEEYALALRKAEGKINGYVAGSTEDGWDHLERELHRVRDEQTPRPSPGRGRG